MVSKQIKGRDFYGVLMYNQKKIIAGVGAILDSNINMGTVIQQTKEFNLVRQLKPNLAKVVYHTSLNLPYTDKLTDEEFSNLARDYLAAMGFNDNQYIVYKHTDQEHAHIHIVANRVKFSGEVVSDSQDYKRSEAIVRKLEVKYNLTQFIAKQESNVLSKGEIEKCLRTSKVPERLELQNIIFDILHQKINLEAFINKLKQKEINVKLNKSNTGIISGISFEFKSIYYKGSDVHKKLSWNNIKNKIEYYEQNRIHFIVPEINAGIRASEKHTTGIEKPSTEISQNISRESINNREENRQNNNQIKNKLKFRL